jgi:hypothetical protein
MNSVDLIMSGPQGYLNRYRNELLAKRPRSRDSIPGGARGFYFVLSVNTGSGAHPTSYPVGTKGYFSQGYSGGNVKLNTNLNVMSKLTLCGTVRGNYWWGLSGALDRGELSA